MDAVSVNFVVVTCQFSPLKSRFARSMYVLVLHLH